MAQARIYDSKGNANIAALIAALRPTEEDARQFVRDSRDRVSA
jgi:hypothetical protein